METLIVYKDSDAIFGKLREISFREKLLIFNSNKKFQEPDRTKLLNFWTIHSTDKINDRILYCLASLAEFRQSDSIYLFQMYAGSNVLFNKIRFAIIKLNIGDKILTKQQHQKCCSQKDFINHIIEYDASDECYLEIIKYLFLNQDDVIDTVAKARKYLMFV